MYNSYSVVPWYRRQWAFWLMYFTVSPIALGISLFGDIYYVKNGQVVSFGVANRIVAAIGSVLIIFSMAMPGS